LIECIDLLREIKLRLNNNTIGDLFDRARDTKQRIAADNVGFPSHERN
jgi:hypothetical protein